MLTGLLAVPFQLLQTAAGENVIFIFPNSKEPSLIQFFDPPIQIIDKGEAIVFVNPDSVDHHLVVKSDNEGGAQVFDTGVLKPNQFAQHAFENYGNYTIECTIYPHMKGEIRVTGDILTLTESIPGQNLDVQLSRSPAFPKVGEDTLFKVTFIDSATGRNHQHIDFALTFEDPTGNYVDGIGGHTVDGAEFGSFAFDQEGAFTPKVRVEGIDFVPIEPATVEFGNVVTPEFPPAVAGAILAAAIGSVALYRKKYSSLFRG